LLLVEKPLVRFTANPLMRQDGQAPEEFDHLSRIPDMLRTNL
jgi:hypothetical protein